MKDKITITVRLFGAFREYGETARLTLAQGSNIDDVRRKLAETLNLRDDELINKSALADDRNIITDMVFTDDANLAILPPVCGG